MTQNSLSRRSSNHSSFRACVAMTMLAGSTTAFAQAAFYPLGTAPTFNDSNGTAISADGLSIIRVSAKFEFPLGLVRKVEKIRAPWATPTAVELAQADLTLPQGVGVGLNQAGSVAVGYGPLFESTLTKGLTWTDPSVIPAIGSSGGDAAEEYTDIAGTVPIVVGNKRFFATSFYQPFFKSSAGVFDLAVIPGSTYNAANAVNGDGTVIVGYSQTDSGLGFGNNDVAVKWSGDLSGFPVELGYITDDPSFRQSVALGVSGDGTTTVGRSNRGNGYGSFVSHPFRHTETFEMQDLFGDRFEQAEAVDASFDGNVVVGNRYFGDGGGAPWVWVPWRGARDIELVLTAAGVDLTRYSLFSCSSVSDDGRTVTGNAYSSVSGFQVVTWVAILPIDCPADYDGDGFVTGEDFDAFVAAFENGDITADFNGDGFVTGEDFDAYVVAFESGC